MAEEERLRFPHGHRPRLRVKEQDGDPTVEGVREIRVPNGALTNEGKGVLSLLLAASAHTHVEADVTDLDHATPIAAAVAVHASLADPHPGYLTPAEHTAIGDGAPHHAQSHNHSAAGDGTALTPVTVDASTSVSADHLYEHTATHGVDIDGVLCKDDAVETDAIRGLRETSGPTALTVGTITDGEYLKRVGATVVSGTPAGGGGGVSDATFSF